VYGLGGCGAYGSKGVEVWRGGAVGVYPVWRGECKGMHWGVRVCMDLGVWGYGLGAHLNLAPTSYNICR